MVGLDHVEVSRENAERTSAGLYAFSLRGGS